MCSSEDDSKTFITSHKKHTRQYCVHVAPEHINWYMKSSSEYNGAYNAHVVVCANMKSAAVTLWYRSTPCFFCTSANIYATTVFVCTCFIPTASFNTSIVSCQNASLIIQNMNPLHIGNIHTQMKRLQSTRQSAAVISVLWLEASYIIHYCAFTIHYYKLCLTCDNRYALWK